jgi:hypothetical protein
MNIRVNFKDIGYKDYTNIIKIVQTDEEIIFFRKEAIYREKKSQIKDFVVRKSE